MPTTTELFKQAKRHHQSGQLVLAEKLYRQVLQADPGYADGWHFLGLVEREIGRPDLAVEYISQALRFIPDFAPAHYNLGVVLGEQGKLEEAKACYHQALRLKPDYIEAHSNLGVIFRDQGKLEAAEACYCEALRLKPDHAETLSNLGNVLRDQNKLEEAGSCCREAIRLKPNLAEAHNNLGNVLREQGKLAEAEACCRAALRVKPDFVGAHSNLLYSLIFSPQHNAQSILAEHQRWNQQHAEPLTRHIQPHSNQRAPDRRLRIGYVSPDFRDHCQAFFLMPLLSCHDRRNVEIFCYADVVCPDKVTERLRVHADTWRDIRRLKDDQVAELVRQDGIDILVDLTMHMARNRLLVFARRPAPVQVTWLAYPGTTGLAAIDYRFTDVFLDPPDLHDTYYSEKSIRLPNTFWCYDPLATGPAVNPLPASANGYVTFGNLNNFCKVNGSVLILWARVLHAVPRSRLVLLAAEGSHRQDTLHTLAQEGIEPQRVTFFAKLPRPRYLELYHRIDLGLDSFPYNGHTTSLDAYWMGVPVVTLVGETVVGRAGFSQLSNLGLRDLVAWSADEFVNIVVNLAQDLPRLGRLRKELRARMQNSPLMDAAGFANNVEAAYRDIWQRWCNR